MPINQVVICPFNGVFKLEVLVQALEIIIDRHQMLRTTFRNEGANYYQHLVKEYIAPVELFDISYKSEVEQAKSLNSAFLEIKKTYFSLKSFSGKNFFQLKNLFTKKLFSQINLIHIKI